MESGCHVVYHCGQLHDACVSLDYIGQFEGFFGGLGSTRTSKPAFHGKTAPITLGNRFR